MHKLRMSDHNDDVVHNLQVDSSRYHIGASVSDAGGYLWLGSLIQPQVASIAVPQAN